MISFSSLGTETNEKVTRELPIQVEISDKAKIELKLDSISSNFKVRFGSSENESSSKAIAWGTESNDLSVSWHGDILSVVDCTFQLSPNEKTQEIEANSDSCVFQDKNYQLTNAQIHLSIPQFWKDGSNVTSPEKSLLGRFSSRSNKGGSCDFWCELTWYCMTPTDSFVLQRNGCGLSHYDYGVAHCRDRIRTNHLCGGYTDSCSSYTTPCGGWVEVSNLLSPSKQMCKR